MQVASGSQAGASRVMLTDQRHCSSPALPLDFSPWPFIWGVFLPLRTEIGALLPSESGPSSRPHSEPVNNLGPLQPPDVTIGARTLKPDGLGSHPSFATY